MDIAPAVRPHHFFMEGASGTVSMQEEACTCFSPVYDVKKHSMS